MNWFSFRRVWDVWCAVALTSGLLWGLVPSARAHADLMSFIRHEVRVIVGPTNIDVTVELTFYEIPSIAERQRMDGNGDRRLDATETATYLTALADTLADALHLTVDGRGVALVVLRDPELDLLGVNRVAPAHHALRLAWFARTPHSLGPGSRLVLEDRLWPQTPALDAFDAVGAGGTEVEALAEELRLAAAESRKARRLHIIQVKSSKPAAGRPGASARSTPAASTPPTANRNP